MSAKIRKLSALFFAVLLITLLLSYQYLKPNEKTVLKLSEKDTIESEEPDTLTKIKLEDSIVSHARSFCANNKLDTTWCILIDMKIHSGKYRLFVYDLLRDSILKKGLVSHGCGEHPWGADYSKETPGFSNVHESHCSSLGKYKIGNRGYSSWGINVNYKLHGLETSNSNAYDRIIVLHSWEAVSDDEIYPYGTPEGWGCPAVSDSTMLYLDKQLKKTQKSVLLWQFL